MIDHSNSPFLTGEVAKRGAGAAGLKALIAPYKGATQKTKSMLPLQAKKFSARLDRKKGTTATPFGNPR